MIDIVRQNQSLMKSKLNWQTKVPETVLAQDEIAEDKSAAIVSRLSAEQKQLVRLLLWAEKFGR